MKKIILVIMIFTLIFFFVPLRKVVRGCSLFGIPETTETLTTYQAFKQGFLQIPNPSNNWTFKTEPPSNCV